MKIVSCLILAGILGACVESTTAGDVRLVGGSSQDSGYVEVYYNGQWNAVCVENYANNEGNVACKQLGYRLASSATKGYDYPGSSSDSITVNCYGDEDRMDDCYIYSNCYTSSRLVVKCTNENHSPAESVTIGDVRLVGGSSQDRGYVEVYYNGQWNTVCADYTAAYVASNVACKQLGYRLASSATKGYDYPGSSSDSITVNCLGGEDRMDDCYIDSYCSHSYRLVVKCTNVYTPLVWTILIPLVCGLIVLCVLCVPCVVACCVYCKKKPRASTVPGNTAEETITSTPSYEQGGTGQNLPPSPERPPDGDTHQYNTPRQDVNSGQRLGVQSSGVTHVPLEPLVSFPGPTEAESQNNENEPLLAQFD